jgi:hypothetical protein
MSRPLPTIIGTPCCGISRRGDGGGGAVGGVAVGFTTTVPGERDDSHVWQSRGGNRGASIVFVARESALTKGFQPFVNRLQARGQLDRVVADEYHMVLDSGHGSRAQLSELGAVLRGFGVQIIVFNGDVGAGGRRGVLPADENARATHAFFPGTYNPGERRVAVRRLTRKCGGWWKMVWLGTVTARSSYTAGKSNAGNGWRIWEGVRYITAGSIRRRARRSECGYSEKGGG